MAYLNCGRCGLQIRVRSYLRVDNCARCLAHSAVVAPLTLSSRGVIPAVGWGGSRAPGDYADALEPRAPRFAATATDPGRHAR